MAEAVSFTDIRTSPVFLWEMADLSVVLSFVGTLTEIDDPYGIDFVRKGLYVSQKGKAGVLLPGETRTLDYGIRRLVRQHGIDLKQACRFASFEVVAFDERRFR